MLGDTKPFSSRRDGSCSTTGGESVPWPPTPTREPARFVAGNTFFNYNAYGSLRPNDDPIHLWSPQYVGLAVHAAACGFAYYFLSNGYGRLLAAYLQSNDWRQVSAANYVMIWPSALAIFIGMVTDSFPTFGYRRKGYMLLGWVVSLAMYITLMIMDHYTKSATKFDDKDQPSDTTHSPYPITYLLLSLVASFAAQVAWVSVIAASVEFAQRESLHHRGKLQGMIVALYYVGGVFAHLITLSTITTNETTGRLESSLSIGRAAMILAAVSVGAGVALIFGYHEDVFTNTPLVGMPIISRLGMFWTLCHQKVVYRVLFFAVIYYFLFGLYNLNVRTAVQVWSSVSEQESLKIEIIRRVVDLVSVLGWTIYLRNVNWRRTFFFGSVLYISVYTVLTVLTALNAFRNEFFYWFTMSITDIPRAWITLFVIIIATEIANVGHEGVTVALAMSFQCLACLADCILAWNLPDVFGWSVSFDAILEDSWTARTNVIRAYAVVVGFNLLCLPVILLLPQQKLDAQQMRAFGGYNKHAAWALAILFPVLLGVNLGVNINNLL